MSNPNNNIFYLAIERYKKEAQEAKARGDKDSLAEARWKVKYFKDKIKKKKQKND